MKRVRLVGPLVLVLLLAGASYSVIGTTSTANALEPAEVVRAYYDWYLEYTCDRATHAMRNPLADGAYRSSPYLAPRLIAEVDGLIAGFKGGGFDPFLLAQDVPSEVTVGGATIAGDTATVPVTTSFAGHRFTVTLEKAPAGRWLITAITPAH